MVPDIGRGSRTHGLLVYLYGPGRREEHIDAHLVGSWDGFAPDPGRNTSFDPYPRAALARLTAALDLRVKQAGDRAPAKHVWHCSVRTAPGDRRLSDQEWNTVAQRIVHATSIAPNGDPDGCRWIAVRHAEDHIHIVATLVRGDLRNPRLNYDFNKAQATCRRIEKELGLRHLNAGDGTAAKNPTSAEKFKAERTGRPETSRETLREAVRHALAGAATEAEFLIRLQEAGLHVRLRTGPSGDALGYNVALPGDRNRHGEPIWYPGSKLAPDLSLLKIRHRLTAGAPEPRTAPATHDRPEWSPPARARRHATEATDRATTTLRDGGGKAAAQLVGLGELLDAVALTSPATTRAELASAASAFERATRSHIGAQHADNQALRSAARSIIQPGNAFGRGEDGATTAMLLSTLILATLAAAHWHSARNHAQQAYASRQAAEHLRTAYHRTATTPMRALRENGRALPAVERHTQEANLRAALAEQLLPGGTPLTNTDALTATLAQAERAGRNPKALVRQAIDLRELDTADDVTDVLVWRLRRLARLPAHPNTTTHHSPAGISRPKSTGHRPSRTERINPPRRARCGSARPADSRPASPRELPRQPASPVAADEHRRPRPEMTLVTRTTERTTAPKPALPARPDAPNTRPQRQYEPQSRNGPDATRCLTHPHTLTLRGIPALCSFCNARCDWLLINHLRNVWICCRCNNQWLEPEITPADFDALITVPRITIYPSVEQGLAALGFDGTFTGAYLG